jgi:adenosylcobinamide-GDP ribazoletransferase
MSELLRREWDAFLLAVMFFTRVPVPARVGEQFGELDKAARYFPLVGLAIGAYAGGVTWCACWLWPVPVAVVFGIFASVWLTGAFHEDGLADMVDAFGGGSTRERTLEIMKDSRLGTFGTVALVLALGLKVGCLVAFFPGVAGVWALVAAHGWSRAVSISILRLLPYAREDEAGGKSKPLAQHLSTCSSLWVLVTGSAGLVGMVLWLRQPWLLVVVPLSWGLRQFLVWRFQVRLGGYTGDCLGAAQQLTELVCYMTFLAVLRRVGLPLV